MLAMKKSKANVTTKLFLIVLFLVSSRTQATEQFSVLDTIKRVCKKARTDSVVNEQDPADLKIATDFVQQQLRLTNTPNPESFKVVFTQDAKDTGYYANDVSRTIFVPRILTAVIVERNDKKKFATQKNFEQWYQDICADRIDTYNLLYAQANDKLSQVCDSLEKMKLVFKQQDKRNYRCAQASIDHEKTHILNHDVRKRMLMGSLTPAVAAIAFAGGMQTSNGLGLCELQSYMLSAGLVITSLPSYFLAYRACEREQERRADAGIRNDPKILDAAAERYEYWAEMIANADAHSPDVHPLRNLISTHPLHKKRAAELKRRAAQRHIKSYD